ncbi:MAG: sedoheptulokinase [Acutalibacteraceae bacterium]|jgi:sedoheptulokinase
MNVLGIDIGTTSICAVVVDAQTGEIKKSISIDNDNLLESKYPFERIQNPVAIVEKCLSITQKLCDEFSPLAGIGVTGQMHGIVYIDKDAEAVSPLYFWQDESGNEAYNDELSYAEYLSNLTGYKMATGYGASTYFYHSQNGRVPEEAVSICTIHDYLVNKLCGLNRPLMHTSDAASLGLFDLNLLKFDSEAIESAGLDYSFFPEVTGNFEVGGTFRDVPVAVAIGDNQASFLGSVKEMGSALLVNVGTGSQISFLTDAITPGSLEVRPCFNDKYLRVGSSLCGGRAFSVLEKFLRNTAALVTGEKIPSAYAAIDRYLDNAETPDNALKIDTRFAGTRENPELRGSVQNLGTDNFTPGHFIWGVIEGIADELKDMYDDFGASGHKMLVGSGNGLRKNKALCRTFAEKFGLELHIPLHTEEAAFGAALFALTATGYCADIKEAQRLIRYKSII